ncbi:MAG: SAM-dependent DNA methyltransferase [Candidatus Wildermuthbacteria bacterium]|nr:SAM-dependent DNA methyltransferase [Candidatus Wildermuthbacteria bacterium]
MAENIIKQIQNIMREDAGVDGDAQRLSQIVWMLFLKIFDDQERQYELIDPKYKSPLPEELRWRNWAVDSEGITGDELLDFVNNKLFKILKEFSYGSKDNPRGFIIQQVFQDTYNYMKSGTLIRQVLNKLNEADFNRKEDRHQIGLLYEYMLKQLQSAGNAGEFYTPRPLTQFVVEMTDPKLGEKVFDPACGTGGFLTSALEYIRSKEVKTREDEKKLQNSLWGVELKQLPHMLAITNMILHGVETPTRITRDDSLSQPLRDIGPNDRVNVIFANPPFGGTVRAGTEMNFPQEFRTKETADLFLVLFIHYLKPGGRAGIVLPDGSLFGEGVKTKIKQKLLEECNLHTIVRLPQGVFNPYAGVNTNLLFFTKGAAPSTSSGQATKEVWYYQLPLPEGMKQYTKNRGITFEEFEPVKKWWSNRKENEHAWKVSIAQVRERGYNLDFKNPNGGEAKEQKDPRELVEEIERKENEIGEILESMKKEI